jgi:hypothetical protein
MKQKKLILAGAAVLVLAVGIYLGSTIHRNQDSETAADETAAKLNSASSTGPIVTTPKAKSSSKDRTFDGAWAQLSEKYGDGRTKLSKKITQDMATLMNDAMQLADMGAKLAGGSSAKELAIRQSTNALASRLGLSEEQKEQAAAIVENRVEQRMNAVTELAEVLQKDPTNMMETILAGDALKRGEITQEEYDAIAGNTLSVMRNVSGFAFSGRGGNDLADPVLAEQLQGVLNQDQKQQLDGIVQRSAESQANNPRQMPFQDGNLPAMELDKLEQTMTSAQKMTTGLKAMMEGLQGMREIAPR